MDALRKNHDEAFLYVAQGLSYEERGEHALAAEMYQKGLERLDTALGVRAELPDCEGPQWDEVRTLQRKMCSIRNEVEFRLQAIAEAGSNDALFADRPPSYDEAVGGTQQQQLDRNRGHYRDAEVLLSIDGATVGILLPSDLSPEMHAVFESLMEDLTAMKIQSIVLRGETRNLEALSEPVRVRRDLRFSQKISDGIVSGSEMLSKGLNRGAVLTSEALRMGAVRLKQYLQPSAGPVPVDPRIKQGMELLRNVTGSVRGVSEVVVNKVGDLAVALGQRVAKNVACEGCVATTSGAGAGGTMNDVFVIASGGVRGVSTLYMGLENAAKTLASSLANETVQIVGHKYGQDAAQVVDHAIYSVGNVALTTNSVRSLGVRGLAKRTAKETGKAILEEYVSSLERDPRFSGDPLVASLRMQPK
ncbi:conserved hypothetical protein [Ixodes scapularis]|uniref:Spartin n=1 Tax=Ixodes scapularis TaxID=6945 RepID=B7Q7T2_IXOSC|nr:conserved hypothetical protein [Ixodes scapularis]|eukprot:XP_002404361.1 conserved hypothetical protein [Ixodes scapularis]